MIRRTTAVVVWSAVSTRLALHPAEKRKPRAATLPDLSRRAWELTHARCEAFSEAGLAHRIRQYLPEQGQLFVGNSTVVRLIDAFSQLPAGYPVYSNRGASGIDGLISTAAGVQRASAKSTLAIVGISPRSTTSTRWRCCVRRLPRSC